MYEDQRGYQRLAVDKRRKYSTPVHTCSSLISGRNILNRLIEEFELCPKLCNVQTNTEACTGKKAELCACTGHENMADYNVRINQALEALKDTLPTFAIRDEGRNNEEHSCILIENGRFYGMGYISHYLEASHLDELKNHLTPYPGNDYMLNIALNHIERYPWKRVNFNLLSELMTE